jgi:hypothetical protein
MKKITYSTILILFVLIPCQIKAEDNKFVIKISSGYSFGLMGNYKLNEESGKYEMHKWQYKLGPQFGITLQYQFTSHLAVEGEIVHQRKSLYEERIDYIEPVYSYSRTSNLSFFTCFLNIIYKFKSSRKQNIIPYLFLGVGVEDISPFIVRSKIGEGISYYFSPLFGINIEISLYPYPPFYGFGKIELPSEIEYLSLNIGLEYKF